MLESVRLYGGVGKVENLNFSKVESMSMSQHNSLKKIKRSPCRNGHVGRVKQNYPFHSFMYGEAEDKDVKGILIRILVSLILARFVMLEATLGRVKSSCQPVGLLKKRTVYK